MTKRTALIVCVVVTAVAAGACGTAATSVQSAAKSTTTVAGQSAPKSNRNRTDTALGRVCWVHDELSRGLSSLLGTTLETADHKVDPAMSSSAIREFRDFLNSADERFGETSSLPPKSKRFATAFRKSIADAADYMRHVSDDADLRARRAAVAEMSRIFQFDGFDGAVEFRSAIREDQSKSCPDLARYEAE